MTERAFFNKTRPVNPMALLLILPPKRARYLVDSLRRFNPDLDIRVWPKTGEKKDIRFAVTWNHPPGSLSGLTRLKAVSSFGAGVDHLLRDPQLPDVPITRVIYDDLSDEIAEFVTAVILNHKRNLFHHFQEQKSGRWSPLARKPMHSVGILGLGTLGKSAARRLAAAGFNVSGWSRTQHAIPNVACYSGEDGLYKLLPHAHFLVCMLPLTPKTVGILNTRVFEQLPDGAYLINTGRGQHLAEADFLAALDSGKLEGACLDVFEQEPLPADHPYWNHP
ncbi:MAG TPA: glyoxylate/hydroxypyruvate reductase A, partial [bacterium]|nr:glyoxylate/hydroxypyruvate reductase A [bacterium]